MDALGDGTRRDVFERLRNGPRSVGDIADGLPVTRPAVSQHLKVLADAGLVRSHAVGTRRFYEIDPDGLGELRDWLDDMWTHALARFERAAAREATRKEQER